MIVEKKPMEGYSIGGGETIGHIELRLLAIPETVKVSLEGEPIIPCSFDEDGHPNFTEEQYMLYVYKKYELKRQNGGEYVPLYLDVTYEERKFDVPREKFDTITGIESSIGSLADLNELIRNRRVFADRIPSAVPDRALLRVYYCGHLAENACESADDLALCGIIIVRSARNVPFHGGNRIRGRILEFQRQDA